MKTKMKADKLDLKKLGVEKITYGQFLGQVMRLEQFLQNRKNYEGLSVLHNLMTPQMMEHMIVRHVAAWAIKDGLAVTKRGLAIRDIDVKRKKKRNENKKRD